MTVAALLVALVLAAPAVYAVVAGLRRDAARRRAQALVGAATLDAARAQAQADQRARSAQERIRAASGEWP